MQRVPTCRSFPSSTLSLGPTDRGPHVGNVRMTQTPLVGTCWGLRRLSVVRSFISSVLNESTNDSRILQVRGHRFPVSFPNSESGLDCSQIPADEGSHPGFKVLLRGGLAWQRFDRTPSSGRPWLRSEQSRTPPRPPPSRSTSAPDADRLHCTTRPRPGPSSV